MSKPSPDITWVLTRVTPSPEGLSHFVNLAFLSLTEVVHLAVMQGKDRAKGVAGLELRCEGISMSEEIPLGLLLVSSAPPGAAVVCVRADARSSRRRTRSTQGAHQNQRPQDAMDTEEDGRERKRVARR
ncbi:hypothetical protein EDB86DRAFT_3075744 [Lactarius hatsudake]|nr:hypothetical protein EDB86DRAFT_3075744 [Lactarius hatsudake]